MNFEQVTPTIVLDIRSKMQDFNPAQKAVANYILSNFYDMEGMPTTFTLSKGHRLNALNISFPGGYIAYFPYSSRTKSVNVRK